MKLQGFDGFLSGEPSKMFKPPESCEYVCAIFFTTKKSLILKILDNIVKMYNLMCSEIRKINVDIFSFFKRILGSDPWKNSEILPSESV